MHWDCIEIFTLEMRCCVAIMVVGKKCCVWECDPKICSKGRELMGIRDEINAVKKTQEDLAAEKAQKEREQREFAEKTIICNFENAMKYAASKGGINKYGVLSGRFPFEKQMVHDDSRDGYTYIGLSCRHNETRNSVHKTTFFTNEWLDNVTISPSQEILKDYEILRKYAMQENIRLSNLYIVYNGSRHMNTTLKVTVPRFHDVDAYYAVDYSIDMNQNA